MRAGPAGRCAPPPAAFPCAWRVAGRVPLHYHSMCRSRSALAHCSAPRHCSSRARSASARCSSSALRRIAYAIWALHPTATAPRVKLETVPTCYRPPGRHTDTAWAVARPIYPSCPCPRGDERLMADTACAHPCPDLTSPLSHTCTRPTHTLSHTRTRKTQSRQRRPADQRACSAPPCGSPFRSCHAVSRSWLCSGVSRPTPLER